MIKRLILALATFAALSVPLRAAVDIEEVTSPGGVSAWLVEEHSIPFVALEIRFKGGTSLDAPGKRGAVNLMVGLLEEGAGDMDAREFAKATEALAASFKYRASDDSVSVSAKFLTQNRDEAVALLRESLVTPRFDPESVERVRRQVLSGIRSNQTDPDKIAARTFDAKVYGDHPYGAPQEGTIDSVTALTREDLQAAHRDSMARDRLYVAAVGDISPSELAMLLDMLFADLPERGAPMPADATPTFEGGIEIVDFDTPQSVVLFGQKGIDLKDPDFFAAYLLNDILGGSGFDSRLMTEVREKRGLTYGVYSYLVDKDHADIWMGSVASANDKVAKAVEVIRAEWRRMRNEGVSAEELQDAKTYVTGAYPLRFDGNGQIANIMVNMQTAGMSPDYIKTRNARVNAVTLQDVNRVARDLLDPEHLTFVVVGRPQGLSN